MAWFVVVKHGVGLYNLALKLIRSPAGHVSCVQSVPASAAHPGRAAPGMTWRSDGRYLSTAADGRRWKARRLPLARITRPEVAFRIPGPWLVSQDLPSYQPDPGDHALEIEADLFLGRPEQKELHVQLVPPGMEVPLPAATAERLAEWTISDGSPWIVVSLYDLGEPAA